jgi:hypothetical protein
MILRKCCSALCEPDNRDRSPPFACSRDCPIGIPRHLWILFQFYGDSRKFGLEGYMPGVHFS